MTLRVAMIGYGFMGAAHSVGWRQAPSVFDLPDDVSVAIAAAKASSTGHLRTKTTRAFTAEEVGAVISKLG